MRRAEVVLTDGNHGTDCSPNEQLAERCRATYRQAAAVCVEFGAATEMGFQYGLRLTAALQDASVGEPLSPARNRMVRGHLGNSNRLRPGHGPLHWPAMLRTLINSPYVNPESITKVDPAAPLPGTATLLRELIGT